MTLSGQHLPDSAERTRGVSTLVVGAGQAGLQLAVSLRDLGEEGPITLIGDESHTPYQRPPLSKTFLAGETETGALAFRHPHFYTKAGIELITGDGVSDLALTPDGPAGSGTARTGSGQTLAFDRLALTLGAAPRRLTLPGSDLGGVCYLGTLDDAARIRSLLGSAKDVVVVGGGFIGLEAAAVARSQGKAVTVVEAADRLMTRAVAPMVSEFYRAAHTKRGTTVMLSAQVSGFDGAEGRVITVLLTDGSQLAADLVLVGVGVVPRTGLAERIGLDCDGGIVVDSEARTSEPYVVAAGDCTVRPHPLTGQGRVRLESVQNAVAQARAAACSLVGRPEHARTVPWFWSDQDDLKLQIAGLSAGYDHHVLRGEPRSEQFSVLYYQDEQLIAVDAVNSPVDYLVVRKALTQGVNLPVDLAGNSATPLKAVLASAAG